MATQSNPELQGTPSVVKSLPQAPSKRWTAKEIKDLMVDRFMGFQSGYMGAVAEVTNYHSADIIGVQWRKRTVVEFEIKVSKADLAKELKAIRTAWRYDNHGDYINSSAYSHTKYNKHCHYAGQEIYKVKPPHLFSFCLPHDLVEYAVEQLQGIPFGVYDFDEEVFAKRPVRLHDEPIDGQTALYLFARACTQWSDSRHIEVNDLVAPEPLANTDVANPPSEPNKNGV